MNTQTTIIELPVYVDTGGLRPQDDVDHRSFVAYRDRAKIIDDRGPPFFSGRAHEINVFRKVLEAVGAGILADSTFVAEGPPGAGKTALMAQCIGEVSACPRTGAGRQWLPVVIHSSTSNSAQAVGRAVDRAVASHLAKQINQERRDALLADIRSLVEGVDSKDRQLAKRAFDLVSKAGETLSRVDSTDDLNTVFDRIDQQIRTMVNAASKRARAVINDIFNRGVSITGVSVGPTREISNPSIADVVAERGGAWGPYQIALFVDEGQNIPVESPETTGPASVLTMIHEGKAGASLSLAVFGLPGTSSVLRKVGISRVVAERKITIGTLPDDDCAKAVRRCFAQFKVRNCQKWEQAIVARSHQWPQHLAGYLVSAISEISKHLDQEGGFNAALADFPKAIEDGDRSRKDYYKQRADGLVADNQDILAKHLAHCLREEESFSSEELRDVLLEKEPGLTNEEFAKFRSAAIHSGLLRFDGDQQRYVVAIPSFAAFLREEPTEPTGGRFLRPSRSRSAT